MDWNLAAPLLVGGVLAGVVALLIGAVPLLFIVFRCVRALGEEQHALHERLSREQKRRAGEASVESRSRKASADELIAQELASVRQPTGPRLIGGPRGA